MVKTFITYGTLIILIALVFYLYNRMLGSIPLLICSFVLYYLAYIEAKKDRIKRKKESND
ncbi:hypothetical protein [Jeotgalibacillus soli]|uniref:Uncharacterized protein n=1 Tax=Jeotgalibacillus soli TaxID=889306 RepID=A0A0C2RHT2_9BACL|nr:hypothetical protein [Jeotgalibacillus soli]KIL49735.1 hypothetical protein KP78_12030 [Jeotgalibacillus soli]